MAAFVAPEDLEKLKKFIDFVAANPLILNTPQLGFLKRFVEKLGGKVPEGEFQMPAGGKCPFGGDAKSETKPSPPTQPEEGDVPVVEEESEESEVELDMEEINVQLLEPNVLYLDEEPPKIVKLNKKATKRLAKKMAKKKEVTTKKARLEKSKKENEDDNNVVIKTESSKQKFKSIGGEGVKQENRIAPSDDPLYTSDKEIKEETMDQQLDITETILIDNKLIELQRLDKDETHSEFSDKEKHNTEELHGNVRNKDGETFYEYYSDECYDENEYSNSGEDDESEEDEPLILLSKRRGRPRKYPLKEDLKRKVPLMEPCREICKQKCTQKFTQEQRLAMCNKFWSLSEDDKIEYIRQHTKTKRYTRLKRKNTKSRGNNCCYYLDQSSGEGGMHLIRVCRKYFQSTMCITSYTIKKALEGYEPVPEIEMKPVPVQQQESGCSAEMLKDQKSREKTPTIQQFLDPETGDLITIDTKSEKMKKSLNEPKKKRIRRKPGDPPPEHNPKPIKCAERCIHKCHTKFTEEERKQICDIFWSMDYKRRKDFILARIETKDVETQTTPEFRKSNRPPRSYHTRFFLRSGLQGENKRVCKHFMMATLSINRNFITNAIDFSDKTTGYYTGVDRRGQHPAHNKISPDRKKTITDHINSYPTWIPNKKSKSRYLHHSLNIKRMFMEYKDMCIAHEEKYVSIHYYYRTFHDEFRLLFLSNPEPKRGGGFMKLNPTVSHYTGDEPGGLWLDPSGERLDLSIYNPAESFLRYPRFQSTVGGTSGSSCIREEIENPSQSIKMSAGSSPDDDPSNIVVQRQSSVAPVSSASVSFNQPLTYSHLIDTSLNPNIIYHPNAPGVRHDFNPNLYESNLTNAHAATTSSLFRKL
ncbi:uncharacterized protein LOC142230516 isoform X1 [Haematobia irritans]|uniref:uncharacterized protein LOC142230516 isoform X1 n=1 Tax=Haematobia irritans TaxID=7368 RepID=UPI003F4FCCA9